jgi:hypothetical protein
MVSFCTIKELALNSRGSKSNNPMLCKEVQIKRVEELEMED